MSTNPWIWIAALLTLFIYSFLYRDNPFYKLAEHIFVGVSAGYYLIIYWYNAVYPDLVIPLFKQGKLICIIPGLLGIFFFLRFIPRWGWLSRWSIAFYIGVGSGMSIPATMQMRILEQMRGTMEAIFSMESWQSFIGNPSWGSFAILIGTPLMVAGVICTLSYFFFSMEHRGALGSMARTGIVFLMVGFGASFGYTVMARVSLLIGRMQFLLRDWLGLIQ